MNLRKQQVASFICNALSANCDCIILSWNFQLYFFFYLGTFHWFEEVFNKKNVYTYNIKLNKKI